MNSDIELRIPDELVDASNEFIGNDGDADRIFTVYGRSSEGEGILLYTKEVKKNFLQERENYKSEVVNKGFTIDKEQEVEAHVILSLVERKLSENRRADFGSSVQSAELKEFNQILADALKYGASDIHFIHYEERAAVHFRVNRVIVPSYTKSYDSEFLRKVSNAGCGQSPDLSGTMSDDKKIDVTLRDYSVYKPDGEEELISLRIGRTGAQFGPHTVGRIFKKREVQSLESLGVDDDVAEILRAATQSEKGMLILCGPTGHGKSTTLNSVVDEIRDGRMIQLLSDPIEETFSNPYVTQKNVFTEIAELDYNPLLKSSLRQDPDIVAITEMRDRHVMERVVGSVLTGHWMGTTMHSADPFDALIRLIESGVDKTILAEKDILQCIASQRLLPKLCGSCGESKVIEGREHIVRNPKGCSKCIAGTVGLVCVAEAFRPDEDARDLIRKGDIAGLRKYVHTKGYVPMRERAKVYARKGLVCIYDAQKALGGILTESKSFSYRAPDYMLDGDALNGS